MDLLDFIRRFEGFSPKAYWDNKQWSIGYGTRANGPNDVIDHSAADARLQQEVGKARDFVERFAPNAPEGVKQALTSLTYNAGTKWAGAGLGQAVKNGNYDTAKDILLQYNKAGGTTNDGLVARRAQEANLFDKPLNSSPVQVADNAPLPPSKPQELSIWDNPQEFKAAPYQVAQEAPHSIWDSVPNVIKSGFTTPASAGEAPSMSFAQNTPQSLFDDLGPKPSDPLSAGGVTPAQAALPPPANPLGQGTSFADRFSPSPPQSPNNYSPSSIFNTGAAPSSPFDQVTQGPSGLQPWQVAGPSVYNNPLGSSPLMLPQVNVTPAPQLPPPSPISRPPASPASSSVLTSAPMPMPRPSSDIFSQNVYGTNPTMGPYTTPQDFNLQEQAMKTGYAPWAPQFGGSPTGSPISPTNPLASQNGLLSQLQGPGGLLEKLLSQLQSGGSTMLDNVMGQNSMLPMDITPMPDLGVGESFSAPGSFDFGFTG